MTIDEAIAAMAEAGATVKWRDGHPRLVGDVPDAVVEVVKANKEAFLEAWEHYQRDRYDKAPPVNLPKRQNAPHWAAETYSRVERYARKQSDEVNRWLFARALAYQNENQWNEETALKAALWDLLHWQLGRHKTPEQILETFEEVMQGWK